MFDEDSFFRRPEIAAVIVVSFLIFLGVTILALLHASPGTPNSASASSTNETTTSTTTFIDAANQALYGTGTSDTTSPPAEITTASSDTFNVRYNGNLYACAPASVSDSALYDCTLGTTSNPNDVDLYCSGNASNTACSPDWYPAKLQAYDLRIINGSHYLCTDATTSEAAAGDEQCAKYNGGNPDQISTKDGLKCSPSGSSIVCDENFFPSERTSRTTTTR
jgi:hypothetical protein